MTMEKLSKNPRILRAAAPPPADSISKKPISLRIGMPYVESLESMAKVLGKSPTGLANELLEAVIEEFSSNLSILRPDLMRELTSEEQENEYLYAQYSGQPDLLPRITWLTPQQTPSYRQAVGPERVDIIPANYDEDEA